MSQLQFGAALRARRQARGVSLEALSKIVNYSKGHLGNVERGARAATKELARACDSALGAEGRLSSLVSHAPTISAQSPFAEGGATEALEKAVEVLIKIAKLADELGASARVIADAVIPSGSKALAPRPTIRSAGGEGAPLSLRQSEADSRGPSSSTEASIELPHPRRRHAALEFATSLERYLAR